MALRRSVLLSLLASVPLAVAAGLAGFQDYVPERSDFCKSPGEDSRPVPSLPFTIQLEGRRATLSFPKTYKDTEPSSLIIAYHDTNQTVKEFRKATRFSDPEVNDFAIVVYPHAIKSGWVSEPQNRNETLEPSMLGPSHDPNNDVFWTAKLIDHIKESYCIDPKKVYAVGQGTGGGVVQILSCQRTLGRKIAAFAGVNSALLRPGGKDDPGPWGFCDVGRRPLPVLEIHGDSNEKYAHHPPKDHDGLKFQDWLALWSQLNKCGQHDGPTGPSAWSDSTYVTKLKDGQMSEGIVHGGGAIRVSFRCSGWPAMQYDEGGQLKKGANKKTTGDDNEELDDEEEEEPASKWVAERDVSDEGATILHYILRNVGHGWPRQTLEKDPETVVNGVEVTPPGDLDFDSTTVVLDWLQSHSLPNLREMTKMARYLMLERGGAKQSEEPRKPTNWDDVKQKKKQGKTREEMIKAEMKVDVQPEHWVKQADGTYKLEIPVEELEKVKKAHGGHDEL